MRLVLDTNVVISGFIWGGIPRQILELAREDRVSLFTSGVLLDEFADVLSRGKFASMLASRNITPEFLMQRYGMLATVVKTQPIERTVPNDTDDDAVIACALAAQANIIVTGDSDLLMLHPFQNIQILKAADALASLQKT
ncbi:MAG TPA: putative toxin-antitoxin system toxin component, PIN family [Pseudomonadales bacterium]|nr:putative toxin-antitoxin system toxin component, PIN family [Pseudomonadales bacterium]